MTLVTLTIGALVLHLQSVLIARYAHVGEEYAGHEEAALAAARTSFVDGARCERRPAGGADARAARVAGKDAVMGAVDGDELGRLARDREHRVLAAE